MRRTYIEVDVDETGYLARLIDAEDETVIYTTTSHYTMDGAIRDAREWLDRINTPLNVEERTTP